MELKGFEPRDVFHYGYVVSNMDRALKSWQRMGARLIVPPAIDPIQNVMCSFLTLLDCVPIELIAPLPEGQNPIAGRLAKGGGLDHVCVFVDDHDAGIARMEEMGAVTVVQPCYGAVFNRMLSFHMTRPGLVIELMTRRIADMARPDPLADHDFYHSAPAGR